MYRVGRPPPGLGDMVSLKVDNLTYRTSPETLKKEFARFGDVGDVYIPKDKYSKESRGFAFVRFYDRRDAEDAMDRMDGAMLDGRELRVAMARYARPSTENNRDYRRRGSYRRPGSYGRRFPRARAWNRRRSFSRSRSRDRRYSRSRSRSRSRSHSSSRSRSRSRSYERSRKRRHSRSRSTSQSSESSYSKSPSKK